MKTKFKEIVESRIDHGVSIIRREDVNDVVLNKGVKDLITTAVTEWNHRNKRHPAAPPEVFLGDGHEPQHFARQIARAAISAYGRETVVLDTAKSSVSNRETDKALEELKYALGKDEVGVAVMVEERGLPQSRHERIERLRYSLSQLATPTVNIVVLPHDANGIEMDRANADEFGGTNRGSIYPALPHLLDG